jgi:hypothetical protein
VPPSDDRAPPPPRRLPGSQAVERKQRGDSRCPHARSRRTKCSRGYARNHRRKRHSPREPASGKLLRARLLPRGKPPSRSGRPALEKEASETSSSPSDLRAGDPGLGHAHPCCPRCDASLCNVGAIPLVPLWHSPPGPNGQLRTLVPTAAAALSLLVAPGSPNRPRVCADRAERAARTAAAPARRRRPPGRPPAACWDRPRSTAPRPRAG